MAEKSPYAAKPSSLNNPVPGAQEAEDAFAGLEAQEMPAPAVAQEDAFSGMPAEAVAPPPDQFESEPSMLEANTPGADVVSNFVTRLQAGLAANDNEKLGMLKKKYGEGNATVKDGAIYYRRENKGKFKRLDPEAFELINDLIPDFAREMVTEAALLPGEVGGAMAGTAIGGPGAGTAGGAISGRVATTPAANEFADRVARAAGVPFDPERSKTTENLMGMAGEAVLPAAGKYVAKWIPGTGAYKMAKEAGEKELTALDAQSKEVAQAAEELRQIGLAARVDGAAVGLPGANVSLMGHHLAPDSPELMKLANFAAGSPKFQNAQSQLAEGWGDSARNVLREIAMRGNKGPVAPEKLGETIVNAVDVVRKAEGEAIGKFKVEALKNSKNARTPLIPQVGEQINTIMGELGFGRKAKEITTALKRPGVPDEMLKPNKSQQISFTPPRDIRSIVGKYGITSTGEARAVVNVMEELNKMNDPSRGIRLTDLERARNLVGSLSDRMAGTPAGVELAKLSRGLREQYRMNVAQALPLEQDRKMFLGLMDDYSQLMGNVQTLKNALQDNTSAKAVVSNFFTGKENLDKIKALKAISPESMPMLKEEWINQMLVEFGDRGSKTGLNSKGFLDALNKKYGNQFVKEILDDGPGPNSETLKKVLTVTERLEKMSKGVKVDQASDQVKQGVMNTLIGGLFDIKFKTMNGVLGVMRGLGGGKENAALEIMTRDGIDKYVANYPGKIDKKSIAQNLNDLLAQHKVYRELERVASSSAAKRATKRVIIDEKIKPRQEFEEGENRK